MLEERLKEEGKKTQQIRAAVVMWQHGIVVRGTERPREPACVVTTPSRLSTHSLPSATYHSGHVGGLSTLTAFTSERESPVCSEALTPN